MMDLSDAKHHPAMEEIVDVLCNRTQNTDRSFFQAQVAYFFGKMASAMRAHVYIPNWGEIPCNIYSLALATSGFGKGTATNVLEDEFFRMFRRRFMEDTFNVISTDKLWDVANNRANRNGTDPQEEFEKVEREFKAPGPYIFTFDSGTAPALKQLRYKLLLGQIGSINFQMDEIGLNLRDNTELLGTYLELYDNGKIKQKLVKHTADNKRGDEVDGKTPTNMLLFGTPSMVFDGDDTEDLLYKFLKTGYGRRLIYGWGELDEDESGGPTAEELFDNLTSTHNNQSLNKWAAQFHKLADPAMHNWRITVPRPVGVAWLEYRKHCEALSKQMPAHMDIQAAELAHRYSKVIKLAGCYAFIDESSEVEMDHLKAAILLVEQSGKAFEKMMNQEKAYMRLAKYIAQATTEQTHADLHENLPFYKRGNAARTELMTMAVSWGYKNHIIIKKSFVDGIEFFSGETLEETNLNEITIAYSDHWAYNYLGEQVPFDQLHLLTQAPDMHWTNHHFKGNHRLEDNAIPGFNMITIDVDGGVSLDTVHELLKDYKFMTYTTKRHDPNGEHRFRLMIPTNYKLELDAAEYKEFMNSFMEWLPFKTDESANQRSKKWMTCDAGTYHYNLKGELLDVLPFIPKTSRNEAYKQELKQLGNLDNLERWFAQRIADGNRNNQMIKFALALVDTGMSFADVGKQVHSFNKKLSKPLAASEIDSTIMVTVARKLQSAQGQDQAQAA